MSGADHSPGPLWAPERASGCLERRHARDLGELAEVVADRAEGPLASGSLQAAQAELTGVLSDLQSGATREGPQVTRPRAGKGQGVTFD